MILVFICLFLNFVFELGYDQAKPTTSGSEISTQYISPVSAIRLITNYLASLPTPDDHSDISECADASDLRPVAKHTDWMLKETWGDLVANSKFDCHVLRIYSSGKANHLHRLRGVVVSYDSFQLNHEALKVISSIVLGPCLKESPKASHCFSEPLLVGKDRILGPKKSDCSGTLTITYFVGEKGHFETRDLLCAADEPSNTVGQELFRAIDQNFAALFKT